MKRILTFSLILIFVAFGYSAPPQVEFMAEVKIIDLIGDQVALLRMSLTPEFDILVRVTADTEIRDQEDEPLTVFDFEEGMILEVEGLFTEGEILAQENRSQRRSGRL